MTDHSFGPDLRLVLAPNPSPMTGRGTNTWIVGRGAVAVIDPGPLDESHLEAILAALGPDERISHILVTHAHLDHSALAPALAARVAAPVLAFGTAGDGILPGMAALGIGAGGGEGMDRSFAPDVRLADGAAVTGEGWRLEAIHTPGHLGSHLCFGWGARCFSGDHVMGWSSSIVSPPEGDMGAYMKSLARLASRPWLTLLPGHGEPVDDPAGRIAELVAHRRAREAQILAALATGPATVPALTAAIYSDVAAALRGAAERNVFAHLIDLSARNVVRGNPAPRADAAFSLR